MEGTLAPGQKAPGFSLKDQNGALVKLSDFKGRKVLVYFYPRADTPGCTTQSCAVRDARQDMKKLDVDVATWNREMVLGNRLAFGTVNAGRRHFEAALRDFEAAEARLPGWLGRLITRRLPVLESMSALERTPENIKTVLEFS